MRPCRLRPLAIESEHVEQVTMAGALFLLARGPALGTTEPEPRMANVLRSVAALRAVRWCRQVHGAHVITVTGPPCDAACAGEGDCLVATEEGVGVLVWTADCVPVLLAGDGAVAAVHAGWRGAAGGVVQRAVEALEQEHGCAPGRLTAVIGTAVGPCHYPVGDEVIRALATSGIEESRWRHDSCVDLRGFVAAQLRGLGVPEANIHSAGGCTACDPEAASYRRDGAAAGRQWSMVVRLGSQGTGMVAP